MELNEIKDPASISISVDTNTGKYSSVFTCEKITENAIHYTSLILVMMSGMDHDLLSDIYLSIKRWAGDDTDKKEFLNKVIETHDKYIDIMVKKTRAEEKENHFAIDSTRVFNIKGYYEKN